MNSRWKATLAVMIGIEQPMRFNKLYNRISRKVIPVALVQI
jgi:hypothetical protein